MATQEQPAAEQTGPDLTGAAGDDIVTVDAHTNSVGCDGGALGHPLVYYSFGTGDRVVCQYCGRIFVRSAH